jgi:hypothetical protein
MQKYVIERNFRGAGRLSTAELNAASKKSREASELLDQVLPAFFHLSGGQHD